MKKRKKKTPIGQLNLLLFKENEQLQRMVTNHRTHAKYLIETIKELKQKCEQLEMDAGYLRAEIQRIKETA